MNNLPRANFKLTLTSANIMIVVTMNIGLTGDGDTYPDRLGPIPIIMTSNEANQTRAAVVCWARGQYNLGVHGFLQVSLAASQSEALLSLYEESKNLVTCTKAHFVPKDRLYV
jgi:hypothetical protein